MNKRGEITFLDIVLLFMIIIIGLAFATSVANTKASQTDKLSVYNESNSLSTCYANSTLKNQVNESATDCNITVSSWYAVGDWRRNESQCALGSVTVKNGTNSTLVLNTDYRLFASSGLIQFLNTSSTEASSGNQSYASYNFCGSGYLASSTDRSLANLFPTMLVITLLVVAAGVAYAKFKNQ